MSNQPNILWICPDQQRYDTIHGLGNPHINTPNLDRLVREGVSFTNAYAQNPLCQPSRASFLTGRYPRTVGVRQNGQAYFPAHEKLIIKTLAENGFTCGLVGKLHLAAAKGRVEPRPDDGYSFYKWNHDPYFAKEWEPGDDYQAWLKDKGYKWNNIYHRKNEPAYAGVPAELHQTTWCVEEAINFIDQTETPWLLSLNIFDPHHPYDPPKEYLDRYDPETIPDPKYLEGELENKPYPQQIEHHGAYGGTRLAFSKLTSQQRRSVTAAYYGQVELVDTQIGRLISYLEETGKRENTLIIYMSDHGDILGDHGLYIKGPYFYEGMIKVPLIFSWPKMICSDMRSDALVELLDIVPTLYEILNMPIPYWIQGKSLLPLLTGKETTHRSAVYSEYYNTQLHRFNGETVYATMYFDGRFKIVVYHGKDTGELYDLKEDPNEFHNLWDKETNKRNELVKQCFDYSVFTLDPIPERIAPW